MEFKATISTASDTRQAVEEACAPLSDFPADLMFLFTSHHHGPDFGDLLSGIREHTSARNLIGATGESIIGPDREVENTPALALWAAQMPGVRTLPFVIDQQDIERFEGTEAWHERIGVQPADEADFVVLPEPFSVDANRALEALDGAFPGSVFVGGMASGATGPGQNRLFLNDQVLRQGMVGVSLSGPVKISTVVSQGCRPIGESFVVTKAKRNVIEELGGRPALEVVQEIVEAAAPADRALMRSGLHIGRVVDERLREFRAGDFLIRNVMGVVEQKALAISEIIRPGQTVRFHVRDAQTASDEMRELVAGTIGKMKSAPKGGLLFSCNGRGTRLFSDPHHDIRVINDVAADCAVAGFFAQGEIGPVGGKTFIHGFTSSLILFQEES